MTNEVTVHFAADEVEAETVAGALRANRLHPRVARDPRSPALAIAGALTRGPSVVIVPAVEAAAAREILRPPKRRSR